MDEGPWDPYYEEVEVTENVPRILLFGASKSGKTSISNVVFQKMQGHETLFIESTQSLDIKYVANNAFVQFQVWDFPGDFDITRNDVVYGSQTLSPQVVFGTLSALVFVIDAQDEPFQESIQQLVSTVIFAKSHNPSITFEVFINKVDGDLFLTDEQKFDCLHEIQQITSDMLDSEEFPVHYHLTSIFEHSIYDAFSKVVQKLMPQLASLENLLNHFISSCNMEKSFLFDVVSKIYIATDSNPVDMQTYELCSDMIDVVIDVSCIYGIKQQKPVDEAAAEDDQVEDENPESNWAYDSESSSVIKLSNGMILYLREVNNYLALVCVLHRDGLTKKGLIDYNVDCFKRALIQVFQPSA